MSGPCPRLWQAEASADARLSRADRASFERHTETCTECADERAQLENLHALGARLPTAATPPLRRRFLRNQLLSRANDLTLGKREPKARFEKRAALALAGVLAAGAAFALLAPAHEHARPPLPGEPAFEIAAGSGRWHRDVAGANLRLRLESGRFEIHVHKLVPGQSFVLQLPDGELEVRGTRFIVEIDDRRTRRVAVTEGLVSLQLRGKREVLLGAGAAWPEPEAPASTEEPRPAPSSPAPQATPKPGSTAVRAGAQRPGPAPAASSNAAADFAEAMAAFSSGDFATAERRFSAFEARYPKSGHLEDILFLRAFAYSRRGDRANARALAEEYLRRYPNGFRASDARTLLR
jgi:hypothetical protein